MYRTIQKSNQKKFPTRVPKKKTENILTFLMEISNDVKQQRQRHHTEGSPSGARRTSQADTRRVEVSNMFSTMGTPPLSKKTSRYICLPC